MKYYVNATHTNSINYVDQFDECVLDLKSFKFKIEQLIDSNESHPRPYYKDIIKELKICNESIETALTHIYEAADLDRDSSMGYSKYLRYK